MPSEDNLHQKNLNKKKILFPWNTFRKGFKLSAPSAKWRRPVIKNSEFLQIICSSILTMCRMHIL